jgi:hypothetical protein
MTAILPVHWHADCCLATSYKHLSYFCVRVSRGVYQAAVWQCVDMSQYQTQITFVKSEICSQIPTEFLTVGRLFLSVTVPYMGLAMLRKVKFVLEPTSLTTEIGTDTCRW